MAVLRYSQIFLAVLCFLSIAYLRWRWIRRSRKNNLPTKWPVVGMLPDLVCNSHRIHDYVTELITQSGGTFKFEGPWFANMDMLFTGDTSNVHYILSKNFSNFPKGVEFNRIFDCLGNGIFNADSESWETQRKLAMSLINHHKFQKLVAKTSRNKVEKGLIPVLDLASELETEMDLQELFLRFTFDSTSILILGHDPNSLNIDLPYNACEKAFSEGEEAILYRHLLPESFWKLQRWLQVGREKNLSKAWKTVDSFLAQCISSKHEELRRRRGNTSQMAQDREEAFGLDVLTSYMLQNDVRDDSADKFIRDFVLSLVIAGRDTTSAALTWFFWLVATNPHVEKKIREEIISKLHLKEDHRTFCLSNIDDREIEKLVYLHAALCEVLRLFPSLPLQHKASLQPDILPSGNKIGANARMILCFYAMGRMETIWGKDCLEFKPERWITEQGTIKRQPSFKFVAFNTGPRTCLGKDMTFIQMKIVAAAIIYKYHFDVLNAHLISPRDSAVLQIKDGLKVKVSKRRV